jgi:hypothetical protein
VEEDDGPQTTTVYCAIQARNGDGRAERREANSADMPGTGRDRFVGVQMAREFLEKAPGIFEGKITSSQTNESNERMAELERLVGQLTMENALLKKGSNWLETQRRRNGQ